MFQLMIMLVVVVAFVSRDHGRAHTSHRQPHILQASSDDQGVAMVIQGLGKYRSGREPELLACFSRL